MEKARGRSSSTAATPHRVSRPGRPSRLKGEMPEKGATMKVFLAGGTGAIGRPLVTQLVRRGHAVVATTRTPGKADALRSAGAEPLVLDVLDRDAVMAAVMRAEPDAVIHEATALGTMNDFRHIEREFAQTNRLRT